MNRGEGVQWVFITLFFPLFARSQNRKLDEKKQGADFELVDPSLRPGPVWGAPLKSVGARRGICRGSARAGGAPGLGGAWLRDTEAVSAPGTSANLGQPGPAGTGTPTNAHLCPEGPLVAAFLRPLLTGAGSPLPPSEVDTGRATPSPAPPGAGTTCQPRPLDRSCVSRAFLRTTCSGSCGRGREGLPSR